MCNYNILVITTMFSEDKVTKFYCITNVFCKDFAKIYS